MRARGWCVRGVCIEEMLQKFKSNAACRPVQAPVTCVIKQHMALFRLLLWLPGTPCVKGEGVCVCVRERVIYLFILGLQTFQFDCKINSDAEKPRKRREFKGVTQGVL